MALADLVASATLVAVMVIDCAVLITEGAVYNPFDRAPDRGSHGPGYGRIRVAGHGRRELPGL